MKNFWIACLALLLFAACGKDRNLLTGEIKGGAGKTLYLERFEKGNPVVVDSAVLDESGKFSLEFPSTLNFYSLRVSGYEERCPLLLDSTHKPVVNAEASALFETYTVSGSPYSELTLELLRRGNDHYKAIQSLNQQQLEPGADPDSLLAAITALQQDFNTYKKEFIDKHQASPVLFYAINYFDPITETEYLHQIEAAMAASMPGSDYHKSVSAFVQQAQQMKQMAEIQKAQAERMEKLLKPGAPAPEIELPDRQGKLLKLSSLRGKYVLIDFWASWCGPCRRENPNVVALYEKYHKKGFDIYSVSLDNNREKWLGAISQDKLSWSSHVSDLQMWNSPVVSLYGFEGIPFTVLLDKSGNVIEANLRGKALEDKLKELFEG